MSELTVADESTDNEQRAALQLDARRREMLELMGVRLWWPEPKAQPQGARAEPAAEGQAPAPRQAEAPETPAAPRGDTSSPVAPGRPADVPPSGRAAEHLPSPASARPAPAARASGAEGLLADAPRLLFGQAGPGGWLIVADLPPDMLGSYPEPLAGDEGRLLGNMLRALRLDAGDQPVHLVRVHRGTGNAPAAGDDMPRPFDELLGAQCAPLAPRVVLALGPLAAQALLRRTGPIGKLRGEVRPLPPEGPLAGLPAVASYPLAYLLRSGADKAKAWADLCQAAAAAAG